MKRIKIRKSIARYAVVAVLFAMTFSVIFTASIAAPPDSEYCLVFSDEFDGTSLDTSRWVYREGIRHWCENRPENVSVVDGCLKMLKC